MYPNVNSTNRAYSLFFCLYFVVCTSVLMNIGTYHVPLLLDTPWLPHFCLRRARTSDRCHHRGVLP